jgi:4-amino-4-deoxy-L-arabinose transferase-like glycosyltransferase
MELALLLFALAAALLVRLQLFTGMVRGDDVHYAFAAYELSQGRTHFEVWEEGTARVGLYAPAALSYRLFGVSEASTVLFPLLTSLGTVALVYALGALFGGPAAGALGALLWAAFPLDVFLATDLLPDGPMTFFCTAAVYCSLRARRAEGRRGAARWLARSGLALLWALSIKPTAAATLFFLLAYWLIPPLWPLFAAGWGNRAWRRAGILAALLAGAVFVFLQYDFFILKLARTATDLGDLLLLGRTNQPTGGQYLTSTRVFFIFGPLMLVSLAAALRAEQQATLPLAAWAGFGLLYYEWGTFGMNPLHYNPLQDWVDGRNTLYLFPPLAALAGIYLGRFIPKRRLALVGGMAAGGMVLAAGVAAKAPAGSPGETALMAASLTAVGLLVASLLLWQGERPSPSGWLGGALLATVVIGAALPAPPFSASFFAARREIAAALASLEEIEGIESRVIYGDSRAALSEIDYGFGFQMGHNWQGALGREESYRVRLYPAGDGQILEDGAVLVFFSPSTMPPEGAALLMQAEYEGQVVLRVYQMVSR